jgi:hypothetical protein
MLVAPLDARSRRGFIIGAAPVGLYLIVVVIAHTALRVSLTIYAAALAVFVISMALSRSGRTSGMARERDLAAAECSLRLGHHPACRLSSAGGIRLLRGAQVKKLTIPRANVSALPASSRSHIGGGAVGGESDYAICGFGRL